MSKACVYGLIFLAVVASTSAARADFILGGQGYPCYLERVSATGADLGPYAVVGDDLLHNMIVDRSGHVVCVGGYSITVLQPPNQLYTFDVSHLIGGAGNIVEAWDGRLLVPTHISPFGSGSTGVVEFNPQNLNFVQNLLPISASTIEFNSQIPGDATTRGGALYVGTDAGTTLRYRMTTGGTLLQDPSFALPVVGKMHTQTGSGNLFLENAPNTISRYDSEGSLLGTVFSMPGVFVDDFNVGDNGSFYVLGGTQTQYPQIYQLAPDGSSLGAPLDLSNAGGAARFADRIVFIPAPEPTSLLLLMPAVILLIGKTKRPHFGL